MYESIIKKYIRAKFIVNSIVSFFVCVIPSLILLLVSTVLFDHNIPTENKYSTFWNPHGELMGLYNSNPFLYILFCILVIGLFSVAYSSFSFAISFYVKHRLLAIVGPLFLYKGLELISTFLVLPQWEPIRTLLYYIESYHSFSIDVIEYVAIMGVSYIFITFRYRLKEEGLL